MASWNSGKVTYNGTVTFKHNNESYNAEVSATANWYHQDCVMYFKDGTGQPEMDDFEIDELEVTSLYNEDTETDCYADYEADENYKDSIDEDITDALYDMDSDEWSGGEPDYEEDYYDEED